MKGSFRALLIITAVFGGLLSMKLVAEILKPNFIKYYYVER